MGVRALWRRLRAPREGTPLDPVPSLRAAARRAGVRPRELVLCMPAPGEDETGPRDRARIVVGQLQRHAVWTVPALSALFRGTRQPPPDSEMERYPERYVPFLYGIEGPVGRHCATAGLEPTDGEFIELYASLRRRPDARSTGPLHDLLWQAAAVTLGLRPWSEAEYQAVFGQLTRSARHFKIGAVSRNYIQYLRERLVG